MTQMIQGETERLRDNAREGVRPLTNPATAEIF